MGADVEKTIREFAEKIFFVHFRNTTGSLKRFRETFHDNGELDMAALIELYNELEIDVPIRVDHVPTLKGEDTAVAGYAVYGTGAGKKVSGNKITPYNKKNSIRWD